MVLSLGLALNKAVKMAPIRASLTGAWAIDFWHAMLRRIEPISFLRRIAPDVGAVTTVFGMRAVHVSDVDSRALSIAKFSRSPSEPAAAPLASEKSGAAAAGGLKVNGASSGVALGLEPVELACYRTSITKNGPFRSARTRASPSSREREDGSAWKPLRAVMTGQSMTEPQSPAFDGLAEAACFLAFHSSSLRTRSFASELLDLLEPVDRAEQDDARRASSARTRIATSFCCLLHSGGSRERRRFANLCWSCSRCSPSLVQN
jgi:hypothetical protein